MSQNAPCLESGLLYLRNDRRQNEISSLSDADIQQSNDSIIANSKSHGSVVQVLVFSSSTAPVAAVAVAKSLQDIAKFPTFASMIHCCINTHNTDAGRLACDLMSTTVRTRLLHMLCDQKNSSDSIFDPTESSIEKMELLKDIINQSPH